MDVVCLLFIFELHCLGSKICPFTITEDIEEKKYVHNSYVTSAMTPDPGTSTCDLPKRLFWSALSYNTMHTGTYIQIPIHPKFPNIDSNNKIHIITITNLTNNKSICHINQKFHLFFCSDTTFDCESTESGVPDIQQSIYIVLTWVKKGKKTNRMQVLKKQDFFVNVDPQVVTRKDINIKVSQIVMDCLADAWQHCLPMVKSTHCMCFKRFTYFSCSLRDNLH